MVKMAESNCTRPKYVCGNDKMKLIGTTDGLFPDFGHHLEKEMGGLWLYPVKLLDGFWIRFRDRESDGLVDGYMEAGRFENYPHKNIFYYGGGTMGHTPVEIKRTQLVPDGTAGLIVTYEFSLPEKNAGGRERHLEFDFLGRVNLRPDWLAEELQVFDGEKDELEYDEARKVIVAKDCEHPWYVMAGADTEPDRVSVGNEYGSEVISGRGGSYKYSYEFILRPGEKKKVTFFVAGSVTSLEECGSEYGKLREKKPEVWEREKEAKYEALLSRSVLQIGDEAFEDKFDWVKIHTDWLTLETEGVGRGITAGIPEYVWWFGCDSCYAVQGMMMQGFYELCRTTIQLVIDYSERYNGNGRIIHELLPNGWSPNLGNTQETAHFIYLLWEFYEWTGDLELLQKNFAFISKSIRWLKEQDEDGDYFPSGYGIIEIAGLNMEMIDTAVYAGKAYECYANICRAVQEETDIALWDRLAKETQRAVNEQLWSEEDGLYCDCYASYDKIREKSDMILGQMEEAGDEAAKAAFLKLLEEGSTQGDRERGWLLNKNWVINVPMEAGIAEQSKAERALKRLHTDEFIGQYGMYLEGLRKGAAMTISTGAMAVAQARYGYSDRALDLINRIFRSFSMATPGSISEMSPDYGCFVQAWTAYGVNVPVIRYFFGIQPSASANRITVEPKLPSGWDKVSLKHVRILDGEINVEIERKNGGYCCKVACSASAEVEIKGCAETCQSPLTSRLKEC